jgi:hypothetical protein
MNEKSTPHWWLKVAFECEIPSFQRTTLEELALVMG